MVVILAATCTRTTAIRNTLPAKGSGGYCSIGPSISKTANPQRKHNKAVIPRAVLEGGTSSKAQKLLRGLIYNPYYISESSKGTLLVHRNALKCRGYCLLVPPPMPIVLYSLVPYLLQFHRSSWPFEIDAPGIIHPS